MTVAPAIRLLVVTDDSMFGDYTLAAAGRCPDISVDCVPTAADARSRVDAQAVDCVVLDDDLSVRHNRALHRLLRTERPMLPVVLAADRPRAALPSAVSYHAFVRKGEPSVGASLMNVVRVLATAAPVGDHGMPSATAD